MNAQSSKSKKGSLIPDIERIKELKHVGKKSTKKENQEEIRRAGPKTSREEEKDPNEYPMK